MTDHSAILSSYHTIAQAAELLGIHPKSLQRNIRAGEGPEVVQAPCGHLFIHDTHLEEYRRRYVGRQGAPRFVEEGSTP